jgi:ethanolamine ammonia-lyase large subunit
MCYINHAYADQNDMVNLLTLLGVAECSFIMGIPGPDDIMLNYPTTSFHYALYARQVLGLRPAPEFYLWLKKMDISPQDGLTQLSSKLPNNFVTPLK